MNAGSVQLSEWWEVRSKDRKDDEFYSIGGKRATLDDALYFKKNCLRGNRKKYSIVIHYETRYEMVEEQP